MTVFRLLPKKSGAPSFVYFLCHHVIQRRIISFHAHEWTCRKICFQALEQRATGIPDCFWLLNQLCTLGHFWLVLTVTLTTVKNARRCFYQSKTVDSFWTVHGTVICTANPPFINRQLSNGTVWWMHLNCTWYTVIYTAYPPFINRQLSNGTVWWMHLNCTWYTVIYTAYPPFINRQLSNGTVWWMHLNCTWYTVIYTAYPPFINRQLSNGTVWWMHLNCTWYCYLHSLSTIHKQTVVKWYCVVNASKLYMVLLSTQLIHHS